VHEERVTDLGRYAARSTVRLTTTGRVTGRSHTVSVWFVVADARQIYVQHVTGATADWYKNLRKQPQVQVDFGDGPLAARATPIADAAAVRRVLALIRRKYKLAWLLQLFALRRQPVAALIGIV
jgi:deazaflavin-dependent oxidoreductase (nitroreductase family)